MLLALISKSDCFLFSFLSLVFILLPTGSALLHGKPWRVKRIMTLKKNKKVIKTIRRVLHNVFNGELNYMIKINQKAKYYMSKRLLYCCSIILPLIILQFYCRSGAELAHTILFFFITELWLQSQRSDFYPTLGIGPSSSNYWCFLLEETVRLKGIFFIFFRFFFSSWSLMNFLEQQRWRIKSMGTF